MNNSKEVNFELNLLPVISLLAVLLSFLLLTAAWVQLGAHEVKQALGGESDSKATLISLWIEISDSGSINLRVKQDVDKKALREILVQTQGNGVDQESLYEILQVLQKDLPDLKTALLMPSAKTKFNEVVAVMDTVKKANLRDVGIAPL